MRVSDLTPGEKLYLDRKRNGLNMTEAATEYEVGLAKYRAWEHDAAEGAPSPALGKLTQQDEFLILRRRSGKTIKELCVEVDCCPWWFRQMELGIVPNDRLVEFWSKAA